MGKPKEASIDLKKQDGKHNRALEAERAAARECADRYHEIYDLAPIGYFTFARSGKILDVNATAAKLLARERSQLLGRNFAHFLSPETRPAFARFCGEVFANGSRGSCEVMLGADGAPPSCPLRFIFIEGAAAGGGENCFAWAIDISDRKLTEEALEEESALRRAMYEQSPDGIVLIDPRNGTFLDFNNTAHSQLGYTREEFARLRIADLEARETPEETRARFARLIEEGRDDFETLQRNKQGETRNVRVTAQVIDVQGRPLYHGTWRDITDLKRTREEGAILAEIGRVISSSIDINEVYDSFASEAKKLIHFDRTSANLIDERDYTRTLTYVAGAPIPGMKRGDTIPLKGSVNEIVFLSRKGLILEMTPDSDLVAQFPRLAISAKWGMRSVMCVPLISKGTVIGTLFFHSTKAAAYTDKELRLAEKIAGQIAGAVANAQLYTDVMVMDAELRLAGEEQRRQRMLAERMANENATIAEIGRLIGSTLNIEEVYERFVDRVRKLMPIDRVILSVNNPDGRTRTVEYAFGLPVPGRGARSVRPMAGSANAEIERTRKGIIFQSTDGEDLVARFPTLEEIVRAGIRSFIAVPLIARDALIGILYIESVLPHAYGEQDLSLAERIGLQIAGAVANARLYGDTVRMTIELQRLGEEQRRQRVIAERLATENAVIAEIGRVIGSTLDIGEVYERFAGESRKLIPADRTIVSIHSPDMKTRIVSYIWGVDVSGRKAGYEALMDGTLNERIVRTRKGFILQSSDAAELTAQFPGLELTVQAGMRAFLTAPLFSRDRLIGVLVFESAKPDAYSAQDLDLAERIGSQIAGSIANAKLYENIRRMGTCLQESETELRKTLAGLEERVKERTVELEEINTALKVLIKKGSEDQKQIGENLQANINQLVVPFLKKLRLSQTDKQNLAYLNVLEANLNEIASPFINHLTTAYSKLTPKELKIAALIKEGKMSKEIAQLMGVSVGTIIGHRNNIRRKMHLRSKGANLRSHLISLK